MLSPLFWISFVVVALGIKWVADGLLSLASVELRPRPLPVEPVRFVRQYVASYENNKAA
jgi:hypothetical protein